MPSPKAAEQPAKPIDIVGEVVGLLEFRSDLIFKGALAAHGSGPGENLIRELWTQHKEVWSKAKSKEL